MLKERGVAGYEPSVGPIGEERTYPAQDTASQGSVEWQAASEVELSGTGCLE